MTPQELNSLRVLVVGAGVTGVSVMRYLASHHVPFDVVDEKSYLNDAAKKLITAGVYTSGLNSVVSSNYDVMILSPGIPRAHPMVVKATGEGVHVIGDVELFASVVQGDVIAITGSNGKSTVASMVAHVLKRSGRCVELCGNIGTAVLDVLPDSRSCSTVTSIAEHPIYVLELSSYQLESLSSLAPLSATVLNISDDHLDRYLSLEHYAATKRGVYRNALNKVSNLDDVRTQSDFAKNNVAVNSAVLKNDVLGFSLTDPSAKFSLKNDGGNAALCVDGKAVMLASELSVPGEHNLANALAVMALLYPLQLSSSELKTGLATFKGLEHRTELVLVHNGVGWYNDSKGTNVDACIKAIKAMPSAVILIAGGQGKGVDFSPLRPVVAEKVKAVVLIGEDAPILRKALNGVSELFDAGSMAEAVELSNRIAVAGDVVLLSPACASFDMFDNYQRRGQIFRESVEQLAA